MNVNTENFHNLETELVKKLKRAYKDQDMFSFEREIEFIVAECIDNAKVEPMVDIDVICSVHDSNLEHNVYMDDNLDIRVCVEPCEQCLEEE